MRLPRKRGRTRSRSRSTAPLHRQDTDDERMANGVRARVPTMSLSVTEPHGERQCLSPMTGDVAAPDAGSALPPGEFGKRLHDGSASARVTRHILQRLVQQSPTLATEVIHTVEQQLMRWIYVELQQYTAAITPAQWMVLLKQVRMVAQAELGRVGEDLAQAIDEAGAGIAERESRWIDRSMLARRMQQELICHGNSPIQCADLCNEALVERCESTADASAESSGGIGESPF